MTSNYISKEGTALINVARYLITSQIGERLRTIDSLSEEFSISVGLIQKALTTLENDSSIRLRKQGRNGTFIEHLNFDLLAKRAGLSHVVCAMPLPYTKHYEGLASGLKAQLGDLPLYFAHMRGADARAQCLKSGVHDIAIVSRLAAKELLDGIKMAVDLGENSYSLEHKLICREGEFSQIKRVGVDPSSPDQRILTKRAFENQDVEVVNINYANCLTLLMEGVIDAVVWLPEALDMNRFGLEEKSLHHIPECQAASQAVMLIRKDAHHINALLENLLDINQLLQHQRQVITSEITPSY